MTLIAQALPSIDWSTPGVRQVVFISGIISAVLILFAAMISPLLVKAIRSLGLVKRTWKEEMEAKVQTVAQATATIAEPTNPNAMLPPKQLEDVKKIASGDGDDVQPLPQVPPVPTPETIGKAMDANVTPPEPRAFDAAKSDST